MTTVTVTSIDDPRLDAFRSLKKTNRTRYDQIFVVEGATNVKRLFRSNYRVQSVLVTDTRLAEFSESIPAEATIYVMPKTMASELVGFQFHLGVLAVGHRKSAPLLHDVVPDRGPSLVLFGDQIIDQQNVGTIIRIGSAFGADAVIFGPGSADPFSRRVIKVSMGNGLFMPVLEAATRSEFLPQLKAMNYKIHATVLDETAEELSPNSFAARTAIVFGNESDGISSEVLERCDKQLTLSMLNGTDSVNVAIAAGIFVHAWRTQFPTVTNGDPKAPN